MMTQQADPPTCGIFQALGEVSVSDARAARRCQKLRCVK